MSKHWGFINPATVDDLDVRWWAYYVRAAQQIDDAAREAEKGSSVRDVRRDRGRRARGV